jgi:hypothetical protein
VSDGQLTEKDRVEVEDSLKRLGKEWHFAGGTVRLGDEHTILVEVTGTLTTERTGWCTTCSTTSRTVSKCSSSVLSNAALSMSAFDFTRSDQVGSVTWLI